MPKTPSLPNLLQDLIYIVRPTFVHEWLFGICPPRQGLRVLEPGCGSAKFSLAYALNALGQSYAHAFDIDVTCVDYAHRLKGALELLTIRNLPFTLAQDDIFFALSVSEGQYDLVFNEGVPQHWPPEDGRRQRCIDLMVKWARPGGIVAIVGNNGLNPREQQSDRDFAFTFQGMPPKRVCFTPQELKQRMEQSGLHNVSVDILGGDAATAPLIGGWGVK